MASFENLQLFCLKHVREKKKKVAIFHVEGCILSRLSIGSIMEENSFFPVFKLHECSSFNQGKFGMNLLPEGLVFKIRK